MNKKVVLIVIFLLSGLLSSCVQNENKTNDPTNDLIISNYFPPVGLERTYIQYGTTGKNILEKDVIKFEIDSSGKESIYIHGKDGVGGETIKEYEVNDDSIRVVYIINAFLNTEVDELELTNKKKWDVGDSDNSVNYLTADNLEINVPAGTFQNCIEITQVIKTKKDTSKIINYYAPTVGLIKTVYEMDDGKYTYKELQGYSNEIEQKTILDESLEATLPENFQAGNLPLDTNLISSLNINDYADTVNQYAFNQVDHYLLHRPTSEEINNDVIFYFVDDINIQCDTNGNIKEVIMQQDSPLTEEKLFYVQWLILGLDPDITIDEVNEIIFPNEADQFYQVGEFSVGIVADSNGFTFKAIPH